VINIRLGHSRKIHDMKEPVRACSSTSKYSLDALETHTQTIRILAKKALKEYRLALDEGLAKFNSYINFLERLPPSPERNVKMLLACKFLNHIYSSLLLTECGLSVDAILCVRNALETVAFHRLVCLDPTAAAQYLSDKTPRPVEVRKRLKALGEDINILGKLYSMDSNLTHVSRASERFHLEWETQRNGLLKFGGEFSEQSCKHLFGEYIPMFLHAFSEPN
jgi:hypothetical protein